MPYKDKGIGLLTIASTISVLSVNKTIKVFANIFNVGETYEERENIVKLITAVTCLFIVVSPLAAAEKAGQSVSIGSVIFSAFFAFMCLYYMIVVNGNLKNTKSPSVFCYNCEKINPSYTVEGYIEIDQEANPIAVIKCKNCGGMSAISWRGIFSIRSYGLS